jgi:hypothetical protein
MENVRIFFLISLASFLLGAFGGCSLLSPKLVPPSETENLFVNGDFESGASPWFALSGKQWEGFSVTENFARAGKYSAYIALRASQETAGSKVFGLIQEVSPKKFPNKISGYYRIEHWKRGTAKQYLQFVVVVQGDPIETRYENYQIRYVLAGIDRPALNIQNAKYLFIGQAEPAQGEWVYFERDLHRDFQRIWGRVPSTFSKIRILFEARYDEKKVKEPEIFADVYYDDLYLGE